MVPEFVLAGSLQAVLCLRMAEALPLGNVYDFRTIVSGHVFRENVIIHNRQPQSMKIQVMQPRQIEGELSYNPSLAYIQGTSKMVIQFKLSPRDDFLQRFPKFQNPDVTAGPGIL